MRNEVALFGEIKGALLPGNYSYMMMGMMAAEEGDRLRPRARSCGVQNCRFENNALKIPPHR